SLDWGCGVSPGTAARTADFNLCLIQPTAVGRRVMDCKPIPDLCSHFRAEGVRQRFLAMDVEVVHYQMNSLRFRYASARLTATRANSKPERSGVGKVKCRPALASTAQTTLAVPRRSYSLSRRASRPGVAGDAGRTSACRVIGFSSKQTTGSCW